MTDNLPLLLGICGFVTVVVGVILLGIFVFARSSWNALTGRSFQSGETTNGVSHLTRRRPDLRAQVDKLDFDAAVVKHTQDPGGAPIDPTYRPNLPPSRFDQNPPGNSGGWKRHRSDDYDMDEIQGGLLDDDGDGTPDY